MKCPLCGTTVVPFPRSREEVEVCAATAFAVYLKHVEGCKGNVKTELINATVEVANIVLDSLIQTDP